MANRPRRGSRFFSALFRFNKNRRKSKRNKNVTTSEKEVDTSSKVLPSPTSVTDFVDRASVPDNEVEVQNLVREIGAGEPMMLDHSMQGSVESSFSGNLDGNDSSVHVPEAPAIIPRVSYDDDEVVDNQDQEVEQHVRSEAIQTDTADSRDQMDIDEISDVPIPPFVEESQVEHHESFRVDDRQVRSRSEGAVWDDTHHRTHDGHSDEAHGHGSWVRYPGSGDSRTYVDNDEGTSITSRGSIDLPSLTSGPKSDNDTHHFSFVDADCDGNPSSQDAETLFSGTQKESLWGQIDAETVVTSDHPADVIDLTSVLSSDACNSSIQVGSGTSAEHPPTENDKAVEKDQAPVPGPAPAPAPHSDSKTLVPFDFQVGCRVEIIGRTHKGEQGTVVGHTDSFVKILLDGDSDPVGLMPKSLIELSNHVVTPVKKQQELSQDSSSVNATPQELPISMEDYMDWCPTPVLEQQGGIVSPTVPKERHEQVLVVEPVVGDAPDQQTEEQPRQGASPDLKTTTLEIDPQNSDADKEESDPSRSNGPHVSHEHSSILPTNTDETKPAKQNETTANDSSSNQPSDFGIGCRVEIVAKKSAYRGQQGTVDGHTPKMVYVLLDGNSKRVRLSPNSLVKIIERENTNDNEKQAIGQTSDNNIMSRNDSFHEEVERQRNPQPRQNFNSNPQTVVSEVTREEITLEQGDVPTHHVDRQPHQVSSSDPCPSTVETEQQTNGIQQDGHNEPRPQSAGSGSQRQDSSTDVQENCSRTQHETIIRKNGEPEAPSDFNIGCRVEIVAKKSAYKGQQGTVDGHTPKMVYVLLDGNSKRVRLSPNSLMMLNIESPSPQARSNAEPKNSPPTRFPARVVERILRRSPRNEPTVILEQRQQRVEGGPRPSLIKSSASAPPRVKSPIHQATQVVSERIISRGRGKKSPKRQTLDDKDKKILGSFKLPQSEEDGFRIGMLNVEKIKSSKGPEKDTFLGFRLERLELVVESPLTKDETRVESSIIVEGQKYELVAAKLVADETGFVSFGTKKKCLQKTYCRVGTVDDDVSTLLDIQAMLEELGNFGVLNPRKAAARLELLQSPAYKFKNHSTYSYAFLPADAADIELVDSNGQDGCGFICDQYLEELLGGRIFSQRTVAIQVRIYSKRDGIFKGMLMRKRISSGPRIQLNDTMLKVGPSRHRTGTEEEVMIVITKIGVHPNSTNEQVARLVDRNAARDVTKTFKQKLQSRDKRLSEMIQRLWKALGVTNETVRRYVKGSQEPEGLRHAYVVGVADPTCQLPPGSVYVTGTSNSGWTMDELFVTRCPCMETKDGRMVRLITEQPDGMTDEDWEFLQNLHFGAIIFSNPEQGQRPLPELVAEGDLDGDLYFICWDEDILREVSPKPITDEEKRLPIEPLEQPQEEEDKDWTANQTDSLQKQIILSYDPEWFAKARDVMTNAQAMNDLNMLIGKLYNKSMAIADEHADGDDDDDGTGSGLFMEHPDAIACARAYKKALELAKHGGTVYLPERLHSLFPSKLVEKYLTSSTTQ